MIMSEKPMYFTESVLSICWPFNFITYCYSSVITQLIQVTY